MVFRSLSLPLGLALVAGALLAPSQHAAARSGAAAKPPAPTATPLPLDDGWIYSFGGVGTARAVYRTAPGGSTLDPVPGAPADYGADLTPPGDGSFGVPSHLRHDGSRWYAAYRWDSADPVFPNAGDHTVAAELDAVREGATAGVPLTANRAACIYVLGTFPTWTSSAAGTPDAGASWVGAQWADQDADANHTCETLVSGGIFRADLVYDTAGAIVGAGAATLAVPVPMTSANVPDVVSFSWSPDGSQVAYTRSSDGDLYLAATGSPVSGHVRLATGTYRNVDWSPDQDAVTAGLQTTIAFSGGGSGSNAKSGIWAIKPNGTGLVLLAEAVQGRTVRYAHQTPFWSPAGTHLAYEEHQLQIGATYTHTIRRMAKDGSGNVVLVGESASQPLQALLEWTDAD